MALVQSMTKFISNVFYSALEIGFLVAMVGVICFISVLDLYMTQRDIYIDVKHRRSKDRGKTWWQKISERFGHAKKTMIERIQKIWRENERRD